MQAAKQPDSIITTQRRSSHGVLQFRTPRPNHRKLSPLSLLPPWPARNGRRSSRRGVGPSPVVRSVFLLLASTVSLLFITTTSAAAGTDTSSSGLHLRYTLLEESPAGTQVGNIVEDSNLTAEYGPDQLARLRFRFLRRSTTPAGFIVDQSTGVISTESPIDREQVYTILRIEIWGRAQRQAAWRRRLSQIGRVLVHDCLFIRQAVDL